jgi:hypothetical protein
VAKLGMEDSPVLGNRLLKTLRTKIHRLHALFSNIFLSYIVYKDSINNLSVYYENGIPSLYSGSLGDETGMLQFLLPLLPPKSLWRPCLLLCIFSSTCKQKNSIYNANFCNFTSACCKKVLSVDTCLAYLHNFFLS